MNAENTQHTQVIKNALEEIDYWLMTYANKSVFDTFPEQALREALKSAGGAA